MQILQTNHFKRVYKKLYVNQLKSVNNALKVVIENQNVGEKKKGD